MRQAVPYGGMGLRLGGGIGNVLFIFQRTSRKGVSAECAAPGGNRHEPSLDFDARSGADEAKPVVVVHWRRGSVPSAAELPAAAARPSMNGRPCISKGIAGFSSLAGPLGSPRQEGLLKFQLVNVLRVIGVPKQTVTSLMA